MGLQDVHASNTKPGSRFIRHFHKPFAFFWLLLKPSEILQHTKATNNKARTKKNLSLGLRSLENTARQDWLKKHPPPPKPKLLKMHAAFPVGTAMQGVFLVSCPLEKPEWNSSLPTFDALLIPRPPLPPCIRSASWSGTGKQNLTVAMLLNGKLQDWHRVVDRNFKTRELLL